jgi:RNA polymerase sigma-70 factor (ECF subfamily)
MLWKKRDKREDFERAVEAIFPAIFSTALRLARNRDDAQDLTQEAIVRAFQAYDRFDGQNFKAWMLRILTNVFINRYRKAKRGPDVDSIEDQPAAENVAAETSNPGTELFDGLMGEQVEEALLSLPEEYRVTVLLCDVEGMSYEEIAQALQVPIGTVRSRLARGRAALREKLRTYAQAEGYLKGTASNG